MATFTKTHQDGFQSIHHWFSQVLPILGGEIFEDHAVDVDSPNFKDETIFRQLASVCFIWATAAKILPTPEQTFVGSDAAGVTCFDETATSNADESAPCAEAVNLLADRIGNILGPLVDNRQLRSKITSRIRNNIERLAFVHDCIVGGVDTPEPREMDYFECGDVALTIWGWILSIWLNSQAASESFLTRFRSICRADCFEKLSQIIQESGALLFESVEAAECVKQRLSVCRLSLLSPPASIQTSPSRSDCSEAEEVASAGPSETRSSQRPEDPEHLLPSTLPGQSILDRPEQKSSKLTTVSDATRMSLAAGSESPHATATLRTKTDTEQLDSSIGDSNPCDSRLPLFQAHAKRPGAPISAVQLEYLILENKEFYGESQRLKKILKESESKLVKLQDLAQEKDDEIAHLKSRVNSKSDAESDAVNELLELRRNLNEQTVKVTRLTKHNEWLTSLISQESEMNDLSRSVGPGGPDLSKHFGPCTTSDRTRKEIALLQEDCARIRSQLMEQTTQNESQAERLAALMKEIKSLKAENNKFRDAEVEKECLALEVEKLKTTVESQLATNRILQNELLQEQSQKSSPGSEWYDGNSFGQLVHGSTEIPLHQEILRLTAEKKQLQRQLEAASSTDIEMVRKDSQLLENKLTKFAEELVSTKKQLAMKEEELGQAKFREERLEQSLRNLRTATEQESKASKNIVNRLNEEIGELKQRQDDLSKSLQTSMEQHTDSLDGLQKSVEANNKLSMKVRELEEELKQEQLVRSVVEEELKRTVDKCEVERMAAKSREAESMCHQLQGQIELQKISIEDLKCTINEQSNRLQENQQRLTQSVESVTQESKARKQLSGRVAELQAKLDDVMQQRKQLESKIKILHATLASREKELADSRGDLGSLKQRFSSLESSFLTLRDHCNNTDRECAFLRTELQRYTDGSSGTAPNANTSAAISREIPLRELLESLERSVQQAADRMKETSQFPPATSTVQATSLPSDVDHQLEVVDHFRRERDSAVENEKLSLLKLAEAELAYQRLLGESAKFQVDNSRLGREIAELRRQHNPAAGAKEPRSASTSDADTSNLNPGLCSPRNLVLQLPTVADCTMEALGEHYGLEASSSNLEAEAPSRIEFAKEVVALQHSSTGPVDGRGILGALGTSICSFGQSETPNVSPPEGASRRIGSKREEFGGVAVNDCDEDPGDDDLIVYSGGAKDSFGSLDLPPTRLRLPRQKLAQGMDWGSRETPPSSEGVREELDTVSERRSPGATTTSATTPAKSVSHGTTSGCVATTTISAVEPLTSYPEKLPGGGALLTPMLRDRMSIHGTVNAFDLENPLPSEPQKQRTVPSSPPSSCGAISSSRNLSRGAIGAGNSKRNGNGTLARKNGLGAKSNKAAGFFD